MSSESVAVALDIDHFTVMKQPVQYGGGNDRIAKQFLPVTEALVGSDNDGAPFIPIGDKLEKEVGLLRCYRQISDLINDIQLELR